MNFEDEKELDFVELTFMRKRRFLTKREKFPNIDEKAAKIIKNAKIDDILGLTFCYFGIDGLRITKVEVFDEQKFIELAF